MADDATNHRTSWAFASQHIARRDPLPRSKSGKYRYRQIMSALYTARMFADRRSLTCRVFHQIMRDRRLWHQVWFMDKAGDGKPRPALSIKASHS
ncbi:MAG: hypothetical protein Q7T25_10060 [Sideroxyarcus sp.]|nr:hypothetical protein [Sideroxyarcus sp.]